MIGGTSKLPIGPKLGRNTPNSCERITPAMAAVRVTALGFVHRMWKRMSGPTGAQSTTLSVGTGGGTTTQSQAVEQMLIVAGGSFAHPNTTPKQHWLPEGTPGPADTRIHPLQPPAPGSAPG